MDKRITAVIDGPAVAGESTLALRIAQKLGFLYIDTGTVYRAVALSDTYRLEDVTSAIREPGMGEAASCARHPPSLGQAPARTGPTVLHRHGRRSPASQRSHFHPL